MNGHLRLTACAALATLAAASALVPLVSSANWLLQAAALTALQSAAGAALRRFSPARPLTVLGQALVSLLALTALFARHAAPAGLLPAPAALAEFGRLLEAGVRDVGHFAIPAPPTDGIRLILIGGVLVVALLVDALAVTYRGAAPAGLPLLALYSVAAGLGDGGPAWLWFLCAAAGYLLLLLAEGRERLYRWGHVFAARKADGTTTSGRADGGRTRKRIPVRTGKRIGVLTLGIALLVPAALPSMGGGLLEAARGRAGGDGSTSDDTVSAVNPLVALQDSLNQPENRTALTYRTDTDETQELYLRIVALDQFDGAAWKPSERRIGEVPEQLPGPAGLSPGVRTQEVRTSVTAADWYAQNWLPMPYPASRVRVDGRWRYEPEGRTVVGDRGQTTRGARYAVDSLLVRPTARQLAAAPSPPRALAEEYTKVPKALPEVVGRTARQVTRDAANDYERAVALQDWFTGGDFAYDTEVRAGSGSAAIANFLEQKEGFCVHFAFSMAAMSRTLGIPARVAVGFTPGTAEGDGRMAVGLRDAHAWPELYFEGVGWTRFEPTPTRGTTPSYARPDLPVPDGGNPAERPSEDGGRDGAAPEPAPSSDCADAGGTADAACGQAAAPPDGGRGGSGFPFAPALVAAGAVVLLALLLLPLLWRVRVRRKRLAPAAVTGGAAAEPGTTGTGAAGRDAATAVLDGWRELVDSAWDYGVVPDGAATPRRAAERIARAGCLDPESAEAARRVARSVEGVLYAPGPPSGGDVAAEVRRVREGLRAAAPRAVRVRAVLLPRSTERVGRAAAARWRAPRAWWWRLRRARAAKGGPGLPG